MQHQMIRVGIRRHRQRDVVLRCITARGSLRHHFVLMLMGMREPVRHGGRRRGKRGEQREKRKHEPRSGVVAHETQGIRGSVVVPCRRARYLH